MLKQTILFSTLILICAGTAMAQQPGPQFWRKVGCEPLEPRTRLEAFDNRYDAVIIKGFTRITGSEWRGIRIDAVEMRDMRSTSGGPVKGIVIVLRMGGERPNDNRAFVDYDEIDPLLRAIDTISRVDETSTKLANFEASYKTHGDLEISVFRQTGTGTAVMAATGLCDRATQMWTLDDLGRFKAQIQEAKLRLDEIK